MRDKIRVPNSGYDITMTSLFDLERGENGKLLMPFFPADYGEDNAISRVCNECGEEHLQGEMKELGRESAVGSGLGQHQLYADGFFVCRGCWFEVYADASKWTM